jgi:alpha-glucosidase
LRAASSDGCRIDHGHGPDVADATSAAWWKTAVVYQIYPRSFADASGDGVGDLRGIVSHLDHLAGAPGALGVDAIWLSPFYPSPMADFGYDVADYCDVDPVFGTLADFDELVGAAHARGVRVIVDWVPNHTSDRHPWFVASSSSRDDPKRDWYVWRDGRPDGSPPNNWRSAFPTAGPAWTFHEPTGQWYLHSFLAAQPDLNWENPLLRAAMYDTLRFWLERGVDGFRIDVAHALGKDPELRDGLPWIHGTEGRRSDIPLEALPRIGQFDGPSVHERLREIRAVLDEREGRVAIGEVYILDQPRLVTYVNDGDGLHLAHNFVFTNLPWSAERFRAVVDEFERLAAPAAWPAWVLANHDHARLATRYDDDAGDGPARARVAATMLLTLRGTPFIFQGDELGLRDVPIPPERVVDVDGRDGVRAPLPWEPPSVAGPTAGFGTGRPWLPVSPEAEALNVASQRADPRSHLALYRSLLEVRRGSAALRLGSYRSLDTPAAVYCYVREADAERVLVALNFSATAQALDLADQVGAIRGATLVSTHRTADMTLANLRLDSYEALVARLG